MELDNSYIGPLLSFIRGRRLQGDAVDLSKDLLSKSIDQLARDEQQAILDAGMQAELRLHKFKRSIELPRVTKILGILKGLMPESLLDIGSGRGAFLWPFLDHFPGLPVTAIDTHPQRARDLEAIRIGGVVCLRSERLDVTHLPFTDETFDVVTVLEVLEHISNWQVAITEVVRVARRFVLLSVPSKPDNNPEHIHLLTRSKLEDAFHQAGVRSISFDAVPNHLIAVVKVT